MAGQTKILILMIVLMAILSLLAFPGSGTMAYTVPATPTNIGGGDDKDDDDGEPPPPAGAAVSGYVYNYSTGGREGGIIVVIDGGGWQAQTVTDSNGYYRFNTLGFGKAELNLRLPPGTHPVVYNWPVYLTSGSEARVDLGYYWGDEPPMPVLLTGSLEGEKLTLQVENRSTEMVEESVIEIETPASLRVSPNVQLSRGSVIDFDSHALRLKIDQIPAGEVVTAVANISAVPGVVSQAEPEVQIMLTYPDQHTPQLLNLQPLPAAQVQPAAAQPDEEAAAFSPPPAEAQPTAGAEQEESALPTTGANLQSVEWIGVWLGAMLLAGLSLAGWRAIKSA